MSPDPTTGWHVAVDDLAAYRRGDVHGVSADSIEAHLLRCEHCRGELRATSAPSTRDLRWAAIADEIDRPSRWSRSSTWIRLAVGTPQLATAAAVLALLFAVVPLLVATADERAAVTWFLALAPAFPVAGTLLAYRAAADPAGDLATATPLHSFRLVAMRTAVLLVGLVPAGVVASVALPGRVTVLLGWLVPALASCAVVLAVGTRRDPAWVAAGLASAWAAAVVLGLDRLRLQPLADALDGLAVTRPAFQLSALAVGLVAAAYAAGHRDDLVYEGRS